MDATKSPIVVELGKQRNGVTFRLSPRTEVMLGSWIAERRPASSVFLSFDAAWDFDHMLSTMWMQVLLLLTGLPEERVREMGVRFVSPADREVVFESLAA